MVPMSTPGLINPYSFFSGLPHSYQVNNLAPSPNVIQLPANAQPMTLAGLSSLPFMNSCDLASQLISPVAYNLVSDADLMNADKFMGENITAIRIIMSGKEVGSIIGKKGDNIKKFREESMARINISDGNSPERIVTITGSCEQIHHAVGLMCKRLEDDTMKPVENVGDSNQKILSLRLLILPFQYSAIVGDGGGKMTQIKEISDATIFFGVDFLSPSSERLLTISGSPGSIVSCILELCKILIEINPTYNENMPMPATSLPMLPIQSVYPQSFYSDQMPYPFGLPISLIPLKVPNQIPPYLQKLSFDPIWKSTSNSIPMQQQNISREFFVENEMIGCIIGRGGSTINEIRGISGAQIKISNCEDGKQERRINISGTFDSVQTAQLLINSSLELYKQSMKIRASTNSNTPIILTNPLLPSNCQLTSTIPQNMFQLPQQPYFAFNSNPHQDFNISQLNCIPKEECVFTSTPMPSVTSHYETLFPYVSKMKSTQVNLDGSKNISTMKFKPY